MSEPNKSGGLGSIIMLVTLLVGGVALENQVNLTGSRPVKKDVIQLHHFGEENINARLWQDPFEAVGQALKSNDSIKSKKWDIQSRESGQITVLGVMVSTGPYFVDAENRRRTRYAVLSGLAASGFQPENPEYIGYVNGGASSNSAKHHPAPEMLPYEWFSGNRNDSNGKLITESVLVLWLDDSHFSHKHEEKNKPLENIGKFFKWVRVQIGSTKTIQIRLIGPAGSTYLQSLLQGFKDSSDLSLEDRTCSLENATGSSGCLEIYSTRATKDEGQILEFIKADDTVKTIQQIFDAKKGNEIHFLRTTPTDYHLAQALVRELKLRGIESNSDVALISEWDTDYGRAFKGTICKAWKAFNWKEGEFDEERVASGKASQICNELKNIHYFSYLRGLDGGISESVSASSIKRKSTNPLNSIEENIDFSNLRAEKERQYDYLLRLTGRIEETEKNLLADEKKWQPQMFQNPHFEAFGVLGSDYYDKLVVLQALRKKFEHAQFFTTDMDARLFQPEDFKYVRNLIVASGFGLRLQDDLQKSIPPFRDTYQTSAYLATLLAFEPEACKKSLTQENIDYWLQARVFEVGRTQAFDLSLKQSEKSKDLNKKPDKPISSNCFEAINVNANTASSLHPLQAPMIGPHKHPALVILVLVLILFLCLRFKKHWRWILAGALIVTAYWVGVANLGSQWDEEPLAFFEGVSIWPTDFIRLIAVFISVVVICLYSGKPFSPTSKGKLKENWDDISYEFKYSKAQASTQAHEKWSPYEKSIFWKKVIWRAGLFVFLALLTLGTFGFPFIPFRGDISESLDKFILITFIISFAISLHYSGVHLSDSNKLIESFKGGDMKWDGEVKKKLFADAVPGAVDLGPPSPPDVPDSMKAMLNGPISLRFIAQRTDAVDELIYFPFVILTLGVLSRARVFDNWDFPISLGALFIYGALYVLFKALKVQREAKQWKAKLMDRLEMQKIHFNALGQKQEQDFLELLIEDTRNFRQGAFMPLAEHSFYRALLLPFSGFGAMALLEYMFLAV